MYFIILVTLLIAFIWGGSYVLKFSKQGIKDFFIIAVISALALSILILFSFYYKELGAVTVILLLIAAAAGGVFFSLRRPL